MKIHNNQDIKGIIFAIIFIFIGIFALWDTTNMLDIDSYIFPRVIITVMIALCIMLILQQLFISNSKNNPQDLTKIKLNSRSVMLVTVMLISSILMPLIGFIFSGLIVFVALMMVAKYSPWTKKTIITYSTVAIAVVVGFYLFFSKVLLVPLPTGILLAASLKI